MRGLVRRYGRTVAVDGLDLTVERGATFALLGPNGAGKTTTIECCEGFARPDGGTVRILGLDPVADAHELRPRVGVMLQEGGVYPSLRAREAVALFAALFADAHEPDDMLERVGLADSARVAFRRLSSGQRQLLKLAIALVGKPELVYLDEPTAGLDPHARRVTWQLIRELRTAGTTVLLTTHQLDEAEELADHVAIIDGGQLLALGTPDELTRDAGGDEVRFSASPELDHVGLAAALGVPVTEERPGRYRVAAAGAPQLVAALTAWLHEHDEPLGDLQAGRRRLEDVFLALTRESAP